MRLRSVLLIVGLCAAVVALPDAAVAQFENGSVSIVERATFWIYQQQRVFHRELTESMRAYAEGGGWAAAWALIAASFLYGVFHAAGPGHGKAVMSGYLLTHRETMRRGMLLSAGAAFSQGCVAIAIVYGLIAVAGWLPRDTQAAVLWSERASFALVAGIGLYLLYRALRSLRRRFSAATAVREHHHTGCGHSHGPTAEQVAAAGDWRTALGIITSIGIRPCTGAVIVLVFAKVAQLSWAGIGAVMAMSLGTAITVSTLASAAVGLRSAAARLSPLSEKRAGYVVDTVSALGGAVIFLLGVSLLSAAFGAQHPLGVG